MVVPFDKVMTSGDPPGGPRVLGTPAGLVSDWRAGTTP